MSRVFSLLIFLFLSFSGNSQRWSQIGADLIGKVSPISSNGVNPQFGSSLSISGDGNIIAIGAPKYWVDDFNADVGYVQVYKNINNNWTQLGSDIVIYVYYY